MRLIEYRKSETSDLVEGVLQDDEERYWHLQLVDGKTPNRPGARPHIQFEILDKRPDTGVVAEGYRSLQLSETNPLLMETTWLKLVLVAMDTRDGWEAMMRLYL